MKPLLPLALLLLLAIRVPAQERAPAFDPDAARDSFSKGVTKKPGKYLTKSVGGDPVTKRFYTKDALVVTRQSGATETRPYVAVPLLFRVNTAELLDPISRDNVLKLAALLKSFDAEKTAFAIEGHASAEGDPQRNRELSQLRAAEINSLLRAEGVRAALLVRQEGFGADHATQSRTAGEPQRQQDRRVLVVQER